MHPPHLAAPLRLWPHRRPGHRHGTNDLLGMGPKAALSAGPSCCSPPRGAEASSSSGPHHFSECAVTEEKKGHTHTPRAHKHARRHCVRGEGSKPPGSRAGHRAWRWGGGGLGVTCRSTEGHDWHLVSGSGVGAQRGAGPPTQRRTFPPKKPWAPTEKHCPQEFWKAPVSHEKPLLSHHLSLKLVKL